jgi:hypothetical protein
MPLSLHHFLITTISSPLPLHHSLFTTLSSPLPLRHSLITTLSSPLPHHHSLNTTLSTPLSHHHFLNTTSSTPHSCKQEEGGYMLFTIFHASVTFFSCVIAVVVLRTKVTPIQVVLLNGA